MWMRCDASRGYAAGSYKRYRMNESSLTDDGREDVAFALLLLKDFKSEGRFDPALTMQIFALAKHLGVYPELERLLSKIPPMRIEPR
jgi:hypothetical protein